MACETIGILMDDRPFHITSCHWTGYLPNLLSLLTQSLSQQLNILSMASSSRVTLNSNTGRHTANHIFQGAVRSSGPIRGSTRGASPFVFNIDGHNVSVLIVERVSMLMTSHWGQGVIYPVGPLRVH